MGGVQLHFVLGVVGVAPGGEVVQFVKGVFHACVEFVNAAEILADKTLDEAVHISLTVCGRPAQ